MLRKEGKQSILSQSFCSRWIVFTLSKIYASQEDSWRKENGGQRTINSLSLFHSPEWDRKSICCPFTSREDDSSFFDIFVAVFIVIVSFIAVFNYGIIVMDRRGLFSVTIIIICWPFLLLLLLFMIALFMLPRGRWYLLKYILHLENHRFR